MNFIGVKWQRGGIKFLMSEVLVKAAEQIAASDRVVMNQDGTVSQFRPTFIQKGEPIRRKQTKIKPNSQSRFVFALWKSRSYRRQMKSEHFSNEA